MHKFLNFLLAIVLPLSSIPQTCDLELIGYTPPASENGLHNFVVNFTNTENCGCNEFTQFDGNNCDESTSSHVNNNETVSHIVFGIHYVDEETGEDYGENTDCTSTTFHPGWSYVLSSNILSGGWSSGSSSTFAINPPFSWDCILENPIDGYCWEVVIWQINLSQTADIEDFPEDGWSAGNSFNNTQTYPDIDLSDNVISWCPDPVIVDTVYVYETDTVFVYETDTLYVQLPPDTIVELQIDTVFTQEYVYITDTITEYTTIIEYDTIYINTTDTLFIDNYIYEVDTLYLTEYITLTDTIIDYITLTDTVTEYIVQEIYIDCNTGLPCDEEPPGIECPDWTTIHIPNTFTPNNDGFNDVWLMKYDLNCWEDIEFEIYNRWGTKIYHSFGSLFDSYPYWDGSINGGNHYAVDGVYAYIFKARRKGRAEVIKKSGHITILR